MGTLGGVQRSLRPRKNCPEHSGRVAVQVQLVDIAKERTRGTGTKGSRQRKEQTRLRKEIAKRFVLSKKGYQCYEATAVNVGSSYRTIIPLTHVRKYVFRRQVGWQHPTYDTANIANQAMEILSDDVKHNFNDDRMAGGIKVDRIESMGNGPAARHGNNGGGFNSKQQDGDNHDLWEHNHLHDDLEPMPLFRRRG